MIAPLPKGTSARTLKIRNFEAKFTILDFKLEICYTGVDVGDTIPT
jgi:hypothetical protein